MIKAPEDGTQHSASTGDDVRGERSGGNITGLPM